MVKQPNEIMVKKLFNYCIHDIDCTPILAGTNTLVPPANIDKLKVKTVQGIHPQATGSNPLIGSIACTSVLLSFHPSGHPREFFGFYICMNFQCRGPALRCIYPPNWGPEDPSGVSRYYMSVCLSECPHQFLAIKARVP